MDNTLPEEPKTSLLSLFQVDLENFLKTKFGLMYHLHISPEQIENWPYWEFETHVEQLNEVLKKKQSAEEKAHGDSGGSNFNPQKQSSDMMKKAQQGMPKMPNLKFPK